MNDRIKRKRIRLKNEKVANKIITKIKKHFTIFSHNVENAKNYKFYKKGIASEYYSQFKLKEIEGWKFGLWYYSSTDEYFLFGEYIDAIDKFKPSATYLSSDGNNSVEEFIENLRKIQENPKLYAVDALYCEDALVDWKRVEYGQNKDFCCYEGYQVVRKQNKETGFWDIYERDESITQEEYVNKLWNKHMQEKIDKFERDVNDKNNAFNFMKDIPNKFDKVLGVGVKDRNRGGWRCSPRYEFEIVVQEDTTNEECEEIWENIDYSNINYSETRKYSNDHQISKEGIYDGLDDIKKYHYIFVKEE